MSITFSNLLQHEFIGLKCIHNKVYDDIIFGTVIDETKNTLLINYNGKIKRIVKNNSIFSFKVNNEKIEVDGKFINNRPEDRIKKKNKRNW